MTDSRVLSVELVGSRAAETATELSDWDYRIRSADPGAVVRQLPALLALLRPLAQQWDPLALPPGTPAAFEAAFGRGWLVELLEDTGSTRTRCTRPLQCKAIASARLKNDKAGAAPLPCCSCGRCCATGPTPSWLTTARTGLQAAGAAPAGPGSRLAVSREVIEDDLALIDALQVPIDRLDWEVRQRARSDLRVKILTHLPGVGTFTALVILAEVGDVTRFGCARKLASWAGLTLTVRGSDRTVRHGQISKQGSACPARRQQVTGSVQHALLTDRSVHDLP